MNHHEEAKAITQRMAEDICRVQPMPSDIFSKLMEASTPKSKLIEDGYEPVSSIGLMWVKKDKNDSKQ